MLAIVEPVVSRAQSVLQDKNAVSGYERTVVCAGIDEYDGEIPDAVIIGTPPAFRGTMAPGRDIEVAVSKKFPSAALFVEKPISASFPEDVVPLIPYFQAHESLVAVGYMLRYLRGLPPWLFATLLTCLVVQKMKTMIREKGLVVASTNAWYQSTYASEDKGSIDRQGRSEGIITNS